MSVNPKSAHRPPLMESAPGPETVIDGVSYLYFGGTSYLGLHAHPEVVEAGCAALKRFGLHSATTRLGFGNTPPVLEVERNAARFFGKPAAFYFASGYSTNHIAIQGLAPEVDEVLVDAGAHFSVHEAAQLAQKPVKTFRHHDAADLSAQLRAGARVLVLADGVAPADGRIAPVRDYLRALRGSSFATLHLDDAHGVGVLGAMGRGVLEECGLWDHVNGGGPFEGVHLCMGGTLAKALGGFGGVIPGEVDFVERLRKGSHYFDGASAPAAPVAGCSAAALELCRQDPERRARLRNNIHRLRTGLRSMGIPVTLEPSANVGIVLRDAGFMQSVHEALKEQRILVPYLAHYSGTSPGGLLRIAVCSEHSSDMIDRLLTALREWAEPGGKNAPPSL